MFNQYKVKRLNGLWIVESPTLAGGTIRAYFETLAAAVESMAEAEKARADWALVNAEMLGGAK